MELEEEYMDEGGEVEEQGGDEGEDEEGEDFEFEDEDWNPLLDDPTMYRFVKRVPHHAPAHKNDIYVSRSSKYVAQLARAETLLGDPSISEVHIHGTGAAINRAVSLALNIRDKFSAHVYPTTSTVKLVDDYEPLVDKLPPVSLVRFTSAIHIRIMKKQPAQGERALK